MWASLLVALLALGLSASVLAADITDCAENEDLGKFSKVDVSDCTEKDSRCPFVRGHNVTISINFQAKKVAAKVRQIVHGVMAGVPVPFPLETPDACKASGLTCPLAAGAHTYRYVMFVKPEYPKVFVDVKWELLNEDDKQIVCVIIPSALK